jgi:release factor glutamine methyltransferase
MCFMEIDNLTIKSQKNVYYPREDSYLLAKAVEKHAFGKTLDLGTGTGILGIVAAKKGCEVTFADINPDAISCAKENAKLNNVKGEFVVSDMFSKINGKFDTIIFNPPYLPSEEIKDIALDGGEFGRELIEKFIKSYKQHVNDKHVVLLLESLFNKYEEDVKKLNAKLISKEHYFFEDLVVLLF